ncbi:hypothetical protein WA026_022556 [Henosepilachna vigintioctopunctata]|uniref:PLAT domain-containing protein n=1 Tax=Henosepilachna vigintioctopunctata TaxID=420089 RepID=A0AAW1VJA1_9CUCU
MVKIKYENMDFREINLVLGLLVVLLSYVSLDDSITSISPELINLAPDEGMKYAKGVPCKIFDLEIDDCGLKVSRLGKMRIRASFKKQCNLRDHYFMFHFGFDGKYSLSVKTKDNIVTIDDMKRVLNEQGLTLSPGSHFIHAEMFATSLRLVQMHIKSDQCTFFVITENATATLGRINRNVEEGHSFKVDASKSVNNDLEKKNVGLEYRWNCTDNINYCKGRMLGTKSSVTVQKQFAKLGATLRFTVEVRTAISHWKSAVQIITVNSSRPFAINCIRYCGEEPNFLNPVTGAMMVANCQFNCKKYDKKEVQGLWRYTDRKRKESNLTGFALGPKFIVSIIASSRLKVIAYYGNDKKNIIGEQDFSSYPIPRLENCKVIPVHTKFHIKCDYNEDEVELFEVFILSDNSVVYTDAHPTLDSFELSIPNNSTVKVALRDKNGVKVNQKIPVKVKSSVTKKNLTVVKEELIDALKGKPNGTENVEQLIEKGNFQDAVQVINIVAHEWASVKNGNEKEKEFTANLTTQLVNLLSKVPTENDNLFSSVTGMASFIATMSKDDTPNSKLAKSLSNLCSKLAKQQLYVMNNDFENNFDVIDVQDAANNLLICGEEELDPFYSIFNETVTHIEVTTNYPVQVELSENDIEDYPEYLADDFIEQEANNFLVAGENIMSICRDLGRSLILSITANNDLPVYIERKGISIGVMKAFGINMAGIVFRQHNVSVEISKYLGKFENLIAVQLCTYRNNPLWSTTNTFTIHTNVMELLVSDFEEEDMFTDFGTEPMNISLGVSEKTNVKISGVIDLHNNISKYSEDSFTIIKIKAKSLEAFFIEFYGIGESDHIQMVLADMERPTLSHFSNAHDITKQNNRLLVQADFQDDKFFLMGIVPGEIRSSLANLTFKVYSVSCVEWNYNTSSWKLSCRVHVSSTPETIHCECSHLSTIAGSFRQNDIKEHPKFIEINFTIRKTGSFFIPLIMCIIVALYFFLLVYAIQKRETKEDAVYFLSDVHVNNRFCYLISIKTGGKLDAGTTSDIMIQLFGKDGKSQEHVLNFPDPFQELLQSNQTDLFVLGTSKYLGKLLKIHLWFDCTGSSPNWYCGEVAVCDLQTKVWYHFKVNKWLRVDGKPKLYLEVAASLEEEDISNRSRLKRKLGNIKFGNLTNTIWNPWARIYNPSFGLPKRLSLMLSILLTLMTITMYFYGIPEMLERDSITPSVHYGFNWDTVYIGLFSAAITFIPHFIMMEAFKNSRIQSDDELSEGHKKLPFFITMVIWIILCLIIMAQINFLLIYGYWVIYPVTWQWATSLFFAIIFYVFILENSFQIVLALVGKKDKILLNYEKITNNVEQQRQYLYSHFGEHIFRPILAPLYKVMAYADYMVKYMQFHQKREVIWQMQDLLMIVLFMSFLYIIIMDEKNTTYDVLAHHQTILLLTGQESERSRLSEVNRINDFEEYMERSLIPKIQSYEWYGRYLSKSPGLTTDVCNRYLGVIRIRQHRVEDAQCNVTAAMKFINRTCRTVSYYPQLNFLNFTPAWTEAIPLYHPTRLGYVWGYNITTGQSHFGVSGYYKRGGYIALLGRTKKNSLINFDYLRRFYWMDILSRIIFIEFPFYNVNLNLFNFATVVLEKTPTGYIHKHAFVRSARIVKDTSHATLVSLICSILFMILIGLITLRTIVRIIKTKVWYKRDLWHFADVGIISISVTWMVFFFKRLQLLQAFVKELEEKRSNTFIDYFDMIGVEAWIELLASSLICVITIRIWKLLRFANVFRVVERTLAYSFASLMYCFAYFFICCIGFGLMAYTLFCSTSDLFKDGFATSKTLILMIIGLRGPNSLHLDERDTSLGYAFIVIFYMFSYFFTTILIAILIVNFVRAQQYAFEEQLEYNVKDYTHEGMKNMRRLAKMWVRKFRLKAGGPFNDNKEMVTPKENDVRYMNCVTVDSNRMKAMASVARCVLRKRKKGLLLNKSDHELMMRTVRDLCDKKEGVDEFFFKQDTSHGFKFVDNRRILMIEEIVKQMIEGPEKRAARMTGLDEQESLRSENLAQLEMLNFRLNIMLKAVKDIEVKFYGRNTNNA